MRLYPNRVKARLVVIRYWSPVVRFGIFHWLKSNGLFVKGNILLTHVLRVVTIEIEDVVSDE